MTKSRHNNKRQPMLVGTSVNARTSISLQSYEPRPTIVRALYHPTTSLVRRALLLISFLLLGLGNVWGKVLWTAETSQGSKSIEPSLFEDFNYKENTFLRIYTSMNGRLWIAGAINYMKILNTEVEFVEDNGEYIKSGSDCVKTDDTGTYYELNVAEVFSGYTNLTTYGLQFDPKDNQTITKIELLNVDPFLGKLIDSNAKTTYSETIGLNTTEIKLNMAEPLTIVPDAKYVRIYLEKDGEVVDDPLQMLEVPGDMLSFPENTNRGYYVYEPGGLTASYLDVTLKLSEGEFEDCQVVCVFSKDEATELPNKEPDWDLQYIFSFEYPFKAETILETVAKELPVGPKDWQQSLNVAFDYTANTIKLLGQYGTELSAVNIEESLWDNVNKTNPTPFYVRWFLQDAVTGEEQYSIVDALMDGTGVYEIPEKERYGLYWSSSRKSVSNLSDLIQMTVDGTKIDLSAYNLVCTIATNLDGIAPTNGNGALSHEPNTMALKYVFKFVDTDWAGTELPQWTHTREVLVNKADETKGMVEIPLADSYTRILTEYEMMGKELGENLHIRWYVTYKGESIYSQDLLTPKMDSYDNIGKLGIYWNSQTSGITNPFENEPSDDAAAVSNLFNVDFTKPTEGNWGDYRVVAVLSNDLSTQTLTNSSDELAHEPTVLNMKYVFRFYTEGDFQFVHYKGETNRPYITPETDSRIKLNSVPQYGWDIELGEPVEIDGAIRQGAHTVELEMYINPSEEPCALPVPLQDYMGRGDNLEPAAYFRWYDWTTDLNHDKLIAIGDSLHAKTDEQGNHGLFMLNKLEMNPTHERVGVTYNPSGLTDINAVDYIACDVSKYFDGIYDGASASEYRKPVVMLHEPTLSIRYIYTIRPSSYIVDKIQGSVSEKRGAKYFNEAKLQLSNGTTTYAKIKNAMFNLYEDRGRIIVSLKGNQSQFSVRTALPTFGDYYISETQRCSEVHWYVYYEDVEGLWYRDGALTKNSGSSDNRVSTFTLSSLNGTYKLLSNSQKTKSNFTPNMGSTVHFIGCVGDGSEEVEAIHYEMQFINAPAILVTELDNEVKTLKTAAEAAKTDYEQAQDHEKEAKAKKYNEALEAYTNMLKRTRSYMDDNYNSQGVVDFNNYFADGSEPTNQFQNMTFEPLEWKEAQYGFCYPNIDRFRITTGYSGLTPIHGDYMLLKSINKSGVSDNDTSAPYKLFFYPYGTNELDDYTKTMGGEWGGFIYVDASDEMRTIATLDFDADLCQGSYIYFTAAIADVTNAYTKPQLVAKVYGEKEDGDVLVISFLTSILETTGNKGKWMQVYGEGAIPETVDLTGVKSYKVEIVNFSENTNGADYCVDEICFYTKTAQMIVEQTGGLCDDDKLQLTSYVAAEHLTNGMTLSTETPQTIYYRIFRKTSKDGVKPITYVPYPDPSIYNNGGKDYGQVEIYQYVLEEDGTIDPEKEINGVKVNKGYFISEDDDQVYFKITDNQLFSLMSSYSYYIALSVDLGSATAPGLSLGEWANPNDACDIFSDFFVPKKLAVEFLNGTEIVSTIIGGSCSGEATAVIDDYDIRLKYPTDMETKFYSGIRFDFYVGTYNQEVVEAMRSFRDDYPDATSFDVISEDKDYKSVLIANAANIILSCSAKLPGETLTARLKSGENYFLAMPVDTRTNPDDLPICSPILFTFTLSDSEGKPELVLGFEDVKYPAGYTRVVRIGLEQLNNTKASGDFTLHIPVHSYQDKNNTTENSLVFDSSNLMLSGTNDPTISITDNNIVVATLQDDKNDSRPIVNSGHQYLAVKFKDDFRFYEGFQYELHTIYYDITEDEANSPATGACTADLNFIIKVVPKYVTWNDGKVTDNNNVNTNWNNDTNWSRSKKAELHKTGTNNYEDNIEMGINSTPATFVPMKFTYVTIPSGNVAPKLMNLTMGDDGIYTNIGSDATTNIQYDLMVRYTENTCIDHSITGNVYDCEKFYGNWAKEIYFKPRAELVNQQYLTYEKVWVEKELKANTWTLMSTPLQNTYAGDMYVPAVDGRQETEAFQPINFNTTDYSRTLYPIYQKSWKQKGSMVYTMTNDVRATKYEAGLEGSVTSTLTQWSHTYNDVQEPYSQWKGFAIRAHKKEQKDSQGQDVLALLRLPKEDISYDYYQWDGNIPNDGKLGAQTVAKPTTGKLFTDGTNNISGLTYGVKYGTQGRTAGEGNVEIPIDEVQSNNDYLLVGNPYLCSIDMDEFLKENETILGDGYWTYEHNEVVNPYTKGTINPLQAFLVKVENGVINGDTNITFTPAMMVDGNDDTNKAMAVSAMTMTAANDRGQSMATLSVGEETKSVETLFDSNLEDVPMVYTVADGQAVSIHQLTELNKPIAFGVTCAASNELVEVTFTDVAQLTNGNVYVVDAVTGAQTTVGEGSVVAIQPNDYGRYFLLAGMTTIGDRVDVQKGIIISVRDREVTVTSGEELTQVHALSLTGATVYQDAARSTTASFSLSSGVYIIKAENKAGEQQTVKVIVK